MKKEYAFKLSMNKILFVCSILFLLAILIPLLIIAQYNIPAVDDYSYGILTNQTYEETKSVFRTIGAAFKQAYTTYHDWQGSFSAIFLMALQPGIWGAGAYSITTYFILGTFLLGNYAFFYVILGKLCKASPVSYIPIFAIVAGLSILWCPSPVSSYYWYNGSVYYTFFYGLMLIYLSVLINSFTFDRAPQWYSFIPAILLALFLGGGNYVTGLLLAEIMALLVLFSYVQKKKNRTYLFVSFIAFLMSFVLNMIAPGNAVRAMGNESMNAIDSVFKSFHEGRSFLVNPINIMVVLGLLLIVPLLWQILAEVNYSFKYPIVVTLLSFCLFCSQFTPTLFAQSSAGPFRIHNIIWYLLWILGIINIMYWFGWIKNTINKSLTNNSIHSIIEEAFRKKVIFYYIIVCSIYCIFMFDYGFMSTSSVSAVMSLRRGEAEIYYNEYLERERIIDTNTSKDIVVSPFSVKPYLLFFDDICADSTDWRNYSTAKYYQIDTIRLADDQESY